MKERVVIEDKEVSKVCEDCGEYREGCIMIENCKHKDTFGQTECCFNFRFTPKFKIEKYPTNWEELFCYCENNIPCILGNDRNCLMVHGITFDKKGTIDKDGLIIIENRTIPQMWNIIKSLVEE